MCSNQLGKFSVGIIKNTLESIVFCCTSTCSIDFIDCDGNLFGFFKNIFECSSMTFTPNIFDIHRLIAGKNFLVISRDLIEKVFKDFGIIIEVPIELKSLCLKLFRAKNFA